VIEREIGETSVALSEVPEAKLAATGGLFIKISLFLCILFLLLRLFAVLFFLFFDLFSFL
jgi:hypothetical protein